MSPLYPDLQGRIALVTGGSRGIGAEVAAALAATGVTVVVNGRDEAAVEATVKSIGEAGGEAVGMAADVTDPEAVEGMRRACEADLGPVDILVAFAGGGIVRPGPVEDVTPQEWHSVVDGNLTATFLVIKAFLPGMKARRRGAIVTMASSAGRKASPAPAPYAAAKAGIIMLTRHVAAEAAPHGVRVNCVSPATILTERTATHLTGDLRDRVTTQYPLGRLGTPQDVAGATLYLASDVSSWITGITLDIAGGAIMS
ncbi:SDR family NAD(P)-dependent oxidoreductase [Sphaerisporangium aureirubrum]|uniref:SDR family NAD(P)-dependent oxidoreductase n=1 Tax=Sphaerisporangium aureirubrum TaxID=1544736 RepID=A0ABW1NV38_9ACTN